MHPNYRNLKYKVFTMCEGVSLNNPICREKYKSDTSFWILGVAGILIASLGILLNTFGLFIVWKCKQKHIFQKLIVCLLIFDTILLYFSIIDFSFRGLKYPIGVHLFVFDYIRIRYRSESIRLDSVILNMIRFPSIRVMMLDLLS